MQLLMDEEIWPSSDNDIAMMMKYPIKYYLVLPSLFNISVAVPFFGSLRCIHIVRK